MKLKREKTNYLYYDKNYDRKKQIYNWCYRVLNYDAYTQLQTIKTEITNNTENAFKDFSLLIDNLVNGYYNFESGDVLGYLIGINIDTFGETIIKRDLFYGVILNKLRGDNRKTIKKEIRPSDLKLEKPKEKTKTIIYKHHEVEYSEEYVLINKKPQRRLRDKKTGRFLPQNE